MRLAVALHTLSRSKLFCRQATCLVPAEFFRLYSLLGQLRFLRQLGTVILGLCVSRFRSNIAIEPENSLYTGWFQNFGCFLLLQRSYNYRIVRFWWKNCLEAIRCSRRTGVPFFSVTFLTAQSSHSLSSSDFFYESVFLLSELLEVAVFMLRLSKFHWLKSSTLFNNLLSLLKMVEVDIGFSCRKIYLWEVRFHLTFKKTFKNYSCVPINFCLLC